MILFVKIFRHAYAFMRRLLYSFLSEASYEGKPIKGAPLLTQGKGRIHFGSGVRLGWITGKSFWNSYIFCDARTSSSQISFGKETWIGNFFCHFRRPWYFYWRTSLNWISCGYL